MSRPETRTRDHNDEQMRLAVLIDADNAPPGVVEGLLSEIARFGVASVKRIYGDWTSTRQSQWKRALLKHSINPVQQFAYTSGKNATDSTLIIDAMDLMYTRRFDGFCLVSSDSDFTRLAQRLREEGLMVIGFGERKTPEPFVVACDKFIYTEVLIRAADADADDRSAEVPGAKTPTGTRAPAPKPVTKKKSVTPDKPQPPLGLILQAIDDAADEDGWAYLGPVGSYLTNIRPDFDPRLYGHRKLSALLKAWPKHFEIRERPLPDGGGRVITVRERRAD